MSLDMFPDAAVEHLVATAKAKKFYIAGPMTGIPEYNFPAFYAAEGRLAEQGLEPVNPARRGVLEGWTWEDYLRDDLRLLLECDGIYLLKGWLNSKGAKLEYHVAQGLGMAVMREE